MREQEKRELIEAVLKVLEAKGLLRSCGCDRDAPRGGGASGGEKPSRRVEVTVGTAGKVFAGDWVRKPAAPGAISAPGTTGKEHGLPVEIDHTESPDCPHCAPVRGFSEAQLKELGADRVAVCHPTKACSAVARSIDHTLLKPNATQEEIAKLCAEAREYCFASVCVNPAYVALAARLLGGSGVKVCTVVGFPLGSTTPTVKAIETRDAIANGADEIDMVLNIGALKSGNDALVLGDIRSVREAARGRVLKVILETALLNTDEKVRACALAKKAGADFVKTSTGFGGGGATVEDIRLMRETVGPLMGVKASGGIRDAATAAAMLSAGATRLGTSASIAIVSPKAEAPTAPQGGKY